MSRGERREQTPATASLIDLSANWPTRSNLKRGRAAAEPRRAGALALQGSLLVRHAPPEVADAGLRFASGG
jgi:hypothetical protein